MIGLDQILNKCSDGITAGCTIAWHHVGYVIHYKENIQKLQDETQKLGNDLTMIDGRVERAKNDGEIPEDDVLQWIESANGIKVHVEAFLDGTRENKWCFKWCPNVYRRYKLGKDSEEKIARAISIKEEGEKYMTLEVAHRAPPLKSVYDFFQVYEAFDSRAVIFENIMKALADPCIKMIGLYGPGGVGKTMMATEVGKLAKKNGLFDDVAMATISQTLNEKAVKEKLAVQLELQLDGNAHQLYHRLNNGKRNLVILDDVWKPLNLADIDIPITDGNKGCKVVITSRKRGLCQMMSVLVDQEDSLNAVLAEPEAWTKEFLMEVLRKPEAWTLFKKVAAISVDSKIPSEAKEVCDKCGGLPVTIRAVAAALKGKGKHAWKDALRQLKNYKIKDIADIDQHLLISLKWSYDCLEPKDARSCFLLCSLFPEDAEISIDDLVRYSIGMRLLDQNLNTFDEVRDRVLAMVDVLKTSCLLLDDTCENVVKMDNNIRDVAISIAEDEKRYLVKHGIEKWPQKGRYEHYSAISLRFIAKIHQFPNELECRGLHTLVLKCNNDSPTDFPNNFFNGMENNLEVLDLSEMPIKSLPSSLPTLVKLRMLCLNGGRMMTDITLFGGLRNLEILKLTGMKKVLFHDEDGTGFPELQFLKSQPQIPPGAFCNLCELRVENCQFKFLFTHSIARGLERLQRLEIKCCEDMEEIIRSERQGDEEEIIFHHLKKMVLWELPNLRSFYSSMKNTSTTEANNSNPSRPLFCEKVIFPALEELRIDRLPKITEIWYRKLLPSKSFRQLRYMTIRNCQELKVIVLENGEEEVKVENNNNTISFPQLTSLTLEHLQSLESFCTSRSKTQSLFTSQIACPELRVLAISWVPNITDVWDKKLLPTGSFCQLREVRIEGCDKLVNVILSNVLPRLQNLTELSVQYCPMVEEILSEKGEEKEDAEAKENVILFPQLETLELGSLENLRSFCTSRLAAQHFFKHPELHICNLPNITEIWGKQLLPVPKTDAKSFETLAVVNATWCEKLVNVIPSSMFPRLKNLKSIYVKGCPEMEVIVSKKVNATVNGDIIFFPQLSSLSIDKLYNLKSFCSSSTSAEAQPLFNDQVALPKLKNLCLDQYLQQGLLKGKECAIMNENDDKEIEQDKQRFLKGKEFEIINENDDKETEQDKRRRLKGKEFRNYE
ncbi:Disease resistance protein RPS2 [Camellia lanceoleosa]|uniref:Disease resistance protein RPS2 n=1 Tax=Camellia lanceoleosa TaxID=1840588 RepID=A0ACC0H577_9ERIC|nr:Disease resistance protein RPS2 [Camellia lanceoleosa]